MKHIVELMSEGRFTTVSVYYQNAAGTSPRVAANQQQAEVFPSGAQARYAIKPKMNEMSRNEMEMMADSFPFIAANLPDTLYTYKCSYELAALLRQGDSVVVPSADGAFVIGKVWQTHATAQIDYEAPCEYRWIVQKVNTDAYFAHLQGEVQFKSMLVETEKAKKRDAIRQAVLANLEPGTEAHSIFTEALKTLGVNYAPAASPAQAPVAAAANTVAAPSTAQA